MRRAVWLLALVLAAGCGDNELGVEKVRPNQPPETKLSSGPPDSTAAALYRVQLYWSGTDRDGTVSHYDFILVDHPPIRTHMEGDPGDNDPTRVVITVPSPDDPRWVGTTATDSLFVSLADSLLRDPQPGPGENVGDVRDTPFERWHTFFVRAVDNEGAVDPTPDYRSFNSTNIAPTVFIKPPVAAGGVFTAPPVVVFNWDGEDPVDEASSIEPVASRYVLISSTIDINRPGDTYTSFPDSLYDLPARYSWSVWKRWDADDRSGKRTVVSGLLEAQGTTQGYYIFAVQAMDEGGAITPVFDYQTKNKNNVALVTVSGAVGPVLTVREVFLGTSTFVGGSRPVPIDIAAGQPINFRWSADASKYGGEIVAYRYGWDIRDPDNDQEWSSWALSNTRAPTRAFSTGSHRFFVEVRDNAESITRAIYEITVHAVTRARDLLWVDDTDYQTDTPREAGEDARWLQVLSQVAGANNIIFDNQLDVYDVLENRKEPPPIQKVFDYKAIVWSTISGRDGSSGLRRAAQFFDPIPSRNQASSKAFNFMNIYLANSGALWINGFRPARQLWPDEREVGHETDPVNVTDWDDPREPHPPGIDSVGVNSLLYKMGIEMFDVGSSTENKRNTRPFWCYGLQVCDVAGVAAQTTTSDVQAGHSHSVTIERADVERIPSVSTTYQTSESAPNLNDRHSLTLSPDDFAALRAGATIQVQTDENPNPVPHRHTFRLVDQLGAWGAPTLALSSAWGQGGTAGRTNIEIYNMPNAMRNESPPVNPLPGISLPLYCYVAQLREGGTVFYPDTSDNQPAFILARGSLVETHFSRAYCGFDPPLLELSSHERLVHFVLVRHFRLGTSLP